MSNVFTGMEALDEQVINNTNIDLSEVLFSIIDDETAINEINAEIISMEVAEKKFNMAFEQLESLYNSISEFGISKNIILAVDPNRYLEKNGIVPSYESLSDLPTKDENAKIALEGIDKQIKKYWHKAIQIMEVLWNKIKAMFARIFQMFQSYEKVLDNLSRTLRNKKFISSKVKKKKIKAISSEDFTEATRYFVAEIKNTINTMNSEIEKMFVNIKGIFIEEYKNKITKIYNTIISKNNEHKKFLGMIVEMDNDKPTWKSSGKSIFDSAEKDTLPNLGYNDVNNIIIAINSAKVVLSNSNDIENSLKIADKTYNNLKTAVDGLISEAKSNEDENTVKDLNKKLKLIKNCIDFNRTSYTKMSSVAIKVIKTAIALGNAAKSISEVKSTLS